MRLRSLSVWDMKFQIKYGFYLLYSILTALYIVVLFAMPTAWRYKAVTILIFSDPAAMGLFFMGAIVLLEKSQRIHCAFAVSPIKAMEYITAKVISLCLISLAVATILAAETKLDHLPLILMGTGLSSVIFTLLGIIISTKIASLNQFILWTAPIEIMGFVPALFHLFRVTPEFMKYYPANLCIDLVSGYRPTAIGLFIILLTIGILLAVSNQCVIKMWKSAGGVKL
jgi:fluoroquinolone transport system permease protein